ncbi:ATP-binding protein [Streptomyces goshikiensis]|uniref:ATP-binding protein n=1 Tax=Streptomyces goshikiensis TaxID=1942 RepID=UPI0036BCD28D
MRRIAPLGLRTRLIAAFLLVAAISAATSAALTYREARTAILKQSQDTAVSSMRDLVGRLSLPLPPQADELKSACADLARSSQPHSWMVYAEYAGTTVSSAESPNSTVITDELRTEARAHRNGAVQRVRKGKEVYLTFAMPATFTHNDRTQSSGIVFYGVMPLATEQTTVQAMVVAARDGALPALGIAVIPALLAARSVLKPVRRLRHAALSLGRGKLDTRIEVKGSDELADLARTFNETASALEGSVEELRQAEARARRFAADVSHELRTPLAGMLAVTEVLDEEAVHLDSDTAAALRLITAETGKLAALVEDLMEISRFDARAAELHADEVDVAEFVRKTLERRHWQDRVATELPAGLRARLDPRRFDVVLANLVGNALRHGGADVHVSAAEERRPDGARLVVRVADSGPGIDPEVLPHIFDRFYKADAARTRSAGSGLGLAITLENVRLHGGAVRAANRDGGGALFTVEMPLEAAV